MKDNNKLKSNQIIMNISNMTDIKKLEEEKSIKYINLDIQNPDLEVICYLVENGKNYSYAEKIEDKNEYIYVSYDVFKKAQMYLLDIVKKIPETLSEIEIARFLYITIGKNIGYDINILPDKNETFSIKNINIINNTWGSIYYGKGTNISLTKLFLFLCRLMNIQCELTITSSLGYQKNIITINNRNIITDITQDIPYIQAGFKTQNFLGYNDNIKLDKKIGYIKDEYGELKVEKVLENINYNDETMVQSILEKTTNIINVKNIRPAELKIIYEKIFQEYCPNYNIKIFNLYMKHLPTKEHFIIINYNKMYYCFNYIHNRFVRIEEKEIIKSIEEEHVGIYLNEQVPFSSNKGVHALI